MSSAFWVIVFAVLGAANIALGKSWYSLLKRAKKKKERITIWWFIGVAVISAAVCGWNVLDVLTGG
ncbi:hypothetical protein EOM60_00215 [Candidatus Saccharibacteria bacterium]|nr:hypothetical protein [Candidatus Saccharibacteria bacterium]